MNDEQLSKLERLSKLREQGAISQQEFDQQKAVILGTTPPQTPRPAAGTGPNITYTQTPKINWIRWASIGILVLLVVVFLRKVAENKESLDEEPLTTTPIDTTLTKRDYTLLRHSEPGNFRNLDILIDPTKLETTEIMMSGAMAKAFECRDLTCNMITIWDNEKALELYENKRNDPKWRRKNWPFICEHYVADYSVTVGELNLYPFMDSEYRKWGGKKKRPSPHSFDTP